MLETMAVHVSNNPRSPNTLGNGFGGRGERKGEGVEWVEGGLLSPVAATFGPQVSTVPTPMMTPTVR